jgi:hypothetical protein
MLHVLQVGYRHLFDGDFTLAETSR